MFDNQNVNFTLSDNLSVNVAIKSVTEQAASAIISPQLPDAICNTGVTNTISDKIGKQNLIDCFESFLESAFKGKIIYGDSFICDIDHNDYKHLVIVASVGASSYSVIKTLEKSIFGSLEKVHKKGGDSVTMPPIGTGVFSSCTYHQAAEATVFAILEFKEKYPDAKMQINICIGSSEKNKNHGDNNKSTNKKVEIFSIYAGALENIEELKIKKNKTNKRAKGTKPLDEKFIKQKIDEAEWHKGTKPDTTALFGKNSTRSSSGDTFFNL